jgi:hypothetical protein
MTTPHLDTLNNTVYVSYNAEHLHGGHFYWCLTHTNNTVHYVITDIVESGVKHQ